MFYVWRLLLATRLALFIVHVEIWTECGRPFTCSFPLIKALPQQYDRKAIQYEQDYKASAPLIDLAAVSRHKTCADALGFVPADLKWMFKLITTEH